MISDYLPILVRLTGWVAASFLFLNFFTCWAMPWAKKYRALLLKTEISEEPKPLCFYHNPIAWLAIFFALIHIIFAIFF